MLKKLMRSYGEWVIACRIPVMLVIVALTVFLGLQLRHLKIENTLDLWAPEDHPFTKTTRLIEQVFGGRNYTVIGIVPKKGDVYQPAVLAKVRNIQKSVEALDAAVRQNVVSFAADKAKAIAGSAGGMEVHALMSSIPETAEGFQRMKDDVARNPLYAKALVSADHKAVAVIADFRVAKENANYTPLYEQIREIVDRERGDGVDIYLAGLPVDLRWMEFYIMQMPYYFAAALLIIIGIQYLSFRSLQGMLLPTLTALLSVVWALGLMGLRGYRIDAMNMNTPILIMAVTAGHAIQILKRYYEEHRRLSSDLRFAGSGRLALNHAALVESMVAVGPIMIMAASIAVVVFASLKLSDIAMIRRFGELAASGILAGLILELTLIPTLRSFLPVPRAAALDKEGRASLLDRMLIWLSRVLVERKPILVVAASFGVILVLFSGVWRLKQDNSVKQYYAEGTQVRKDDAVLNSLFGGTNSIIFLVKGSEPDSLKDPKVLASMSELQRFLESQPHVGKTQSLSDLIRRMNRAMHGDDAAYDTIPDSRNLIAQYLLLYSLSGSPQDFDTFVDSDYRHGAVWAFLKTDSTSYAKELYEKAGAIIATFPKGVSVNIGGSLPQVIAINDVIIREKLANIVQMSAILFLLSSLVLRSLVGGLFVVVPLVCVVMANLGFMGWLGIPLNIGTALSASLAIAIGADYELYLMFRLKEELAKSHDIYLAMRDSYLSAGKAIILAAISIAGGYSILLISDCRFYTWFSSVVILTMCVSVFSTVVLLRSMMMLFKPRFVFGEDSRKLFETTPQEENQCA